jgi:hypothetical protein
MSTVKTVLWVIYAISILMAAPAAFADIAISVLRVRSRWPFPLMGCRATGSQYRRAERGTPNGTYHPQRLAASWFSKLYYNSPMPHSIFFHGGYAIHGSYDIHRLGGPASHGCIRLHPANAAALFDLAKNEGKDATTIVVSGSNPVVASGSVEAHQHGSKNSPHEQRPRRNYARVKPTHDDRPAYGWEGPAYGDTYRSDYGRPDFWRPEPRPFPFFNSY